MTLDERIDAAIARADDPSEDEDAQLDAASEACGLLMQQRDEMRKVVAAARRVSDDDLTPVWKESLAELAKALAELDKIDAG